MRRLHDWPQRLREFLEARDGEPFLWGVNDCCMFAAAAVQAITGVDVLHAPPWDETTAARTLRRERGLAGAVTARLGRPLPTPSLAQRGDILLVRTHVGAAHVRFIAVCDADRWAAPSRGGLIRGPMMQVLRAWPVGREAARA
jgi:hypothetical protein